MHYLDIADVYWQARVFWSTRNAHGDYPLDVFICENGYVVLPGDL